MQNAYFKIDKPMNEPVEAYAAGSAMKKALVAELDRQSKTPIKIPLIIGGKEIYTEKTKNVVEPQNHKNVLATFSLAGKEELALAKKTAMEAKESWEALPFEQRIAIFMKAAELLTGKYRVMMDAATMLGQSKTPYEAEIDCVCELADFLRFNTYFMTGIYARQPENSKGIWNRLDYRPLEGFVAAITPFNFTSIGGNLASCPAMCGNTVLWKPGSTAVLSNYYFMKILEEAGLPAGVINFVPCNGADFSEYVITDPNMAGFHFTGSTAVFQSIWKKVGENIASYKCYPRLVGETGGKDFVFAHPSADLDTLEQSIIRGSFAFQGQKCSAASRAYVPASIWDALKAKLVPAVSALKAGDVRDDSCYLNAVIDKASFDTIKSYIDYAKSSPDAEILCGGKCDDSVGYFVEPTVILAKTPRFKTMVEEIFGPVITIYVYDDAKLEDMLVECANATKYALTGAIVARDRNAIAHMEYALRNAAGNFYINDKPTGAVVGQQPFGGARGSGTNDKAGSELNLYRWMSVRSIKENLQQ